MKEADLYAPVKRFLEAQRYDVKGEVRGCDVVAMRGAETVIVELKLVLNLDVILQAVDRLAVTPNVYIGVPRRCRALAKRRRSLRKLLRMLGLGLLVIGRGDDASSVAALLDPADYRPRKSKARRERLLAEFVKRVGDPNVGGSRGRILTVYRQTALQIGEFLRDHGPTKAAHVARALDAPNARLLLYRDVYGWFERVSVGIYDLSPRGRREIGQWGRSSAA